MRGSIWAALPFAILPICAGIAIAREYPQWLSSASVSRQLARHRLITSAAAASVFALGYLVLLGWYLDVPALRSLAPQWVPMKPNAAVGFMLAAVALWLLSSGPPAGAVRGFAGLLAGMTALLGAATLAEDFGGRTYGIDTLLFAERIQAEQSMQPAARPGRMAQATALNFLLSGLALLSMGAGSWRRRHWVMQTLMLWPMVVSLLVVTGYLYGVDTLYRMSAFASMALHAALGFLVLGIGMLFARPDRGWMRVFVEAQSGSIVLRRLVPYVIVLPVLLGWLRLKGQSAGLYGTEFGVGLLVLAAIASFLLLAWWLARALNTAELRRLEAEHDLRRLNAELEQRVAERTRELERANHELAAFSYSVAHDLRTPLRAIDGWAQAIDEDCGAALGAEGRAMLARQRAASQRLGLLIDDLLRLAYLGRQPVLLKPVNPALLIRKIWHNFPVGTNGGGATLVIGELPVCLADAALLELALTNLLDNARKFSRGRPDARVEVGWRQDSAGECIVFIKDNGVGFDMRYAGKLFTPFQRLHNSDEYPGTGVGLTIVQRVIERHGGRVWVEATEGQGATFYFTLPLATAPR